MKIAFYEVFEEEETALRAILPPEWTVLFYRHTVQESGPPPHDADIFSIRTQSHIPLDSAVKLKGILSRSTGYDHLTTLKLSLIANGGIPPAFGYLNEYSTRAVAEHAFLLLSALARKLPLQLRSMERFQRDGLTGVELSSKSLVVVGVGRIGSEIVRIASAFGMKVFGVDILPNKVNVNYITPDEAWQVADAIICSMNLTDENRGYFNNSVYSRLKKGVILVNIARGEHTPLKPLAESLESGILGGVGLDVYENEGEIAAALRLTGRGGSLAPEVTQLQRILSHPNSICTPHNAFNSIEAVRRKCEETLRQLRRFERSTTFDPSV